MQEGILGMPDVDKRRVEPGDYLAHFPEIDVPYREVVLGSLGLVLHQLPVFQDGNVYLGRL